MTKTNPRPSFADACRMYVHRHTMEHVPEWAREQRPDGTYYAPQYRTDREWYDRTKFPGEPEHIGDRKHCYSSDQTWPFGTSLNQPYRGQKAILLRTRQMIDMQWDAGPGANNAVYHLVIPAHTRVRPTDDKPGEFWVDDLSWLDKNSMAYHDAYYRGVRLAADQIEGVL